MAWELARVQYLQYLAPHPRPVRFCLLSKPPGDLYEHCNLRSTALKALNDGDFTLKDEGPLGTPETVTSLEESMVGVNCHFNHTPICHPTKLSAKSSNESPPTHPLISFQD